MKGEVCCICGSDPVLYYSNGRVFCKSHRSEANAAAAKGWSLWRDYRDYSFREYRSDKSGKTTTRSKNLKRDRP